MGKVLLSLVFLVGLSIGLSSIVVPSLSHAVTLPRIAHSPSSAIAGSPDGSGIAVGQDGRNDFIDYNGSYLFHSETLDSGVTIGSGYVFADLAAGRMGGRVESFGAGEIRFNAVMIEVLTITGNWLGSVPIEVGLTLNGSKATGASANTAINGGVGLGPSQSASSSNVLTPPIFQMAHTRAVFRSLTM